MRTNIFNIKISNVLLSGIALTGLFSLVSTFFFGKNFLDYKMIFVLLTVMSFFIVFFSINRRVLSFVFFIFLYVTVFFIWSVVINRDNILDFFLAYSPFVYLFILGFFVKKKIFANEKVTRFIKFLIMLATVSYIIQALAVALGFVSVTRGLRPYLFTENNFEIPLFILSHYYLIKSRDPSVFKYYVLLSIVVFLSFSRSGLLIWFFYTVFAMGKKGLYLLMVGAVFLGLVWKTGHLSSYTRSSDIKQIDRVVFISLFLKELSRFNPYELLVGKKPLVPLSAELTNSLSSYKSLFSYKSDSIAYSVILHIYFLRIIYDHGIFGLLFIIQAISFYLLKYGYNYMDCLVINGVIILSGFSISGYANALVCFLLIMFLSSKGWELECR